MFLQTSKLPWVSLRDNVTGDDTAITAFKYSNWPSSNTVNLRSPVMKDANGVFIAAFGTDTADDVLTSYKLYGKARMNGPIVLLLTGVMTLGTQVATTHPISGVTVTNGLWVDTITVTGGLLSGLVEILDSGNNRACMLKFDTSIFQELYLELDLDTINAFYAIICGY